MRLYTKIILWFFLNLVVLGVAFYAVFRLQFQLGLDSILMAQAGSRIREVAENVSNELTTTPESGWNDVIRRLAITHRLDFFLYRHDGSRAAGSDIALPSEVLAKVTERRGQGPPAGRGPPPGRGPNRPTPAVAPEPFQKFAVQTANPTRYWVGVTLGPMGEDLRWSRSLFLLAMSESLHGGGLFFDYKPWVTVGFAALLFSVLFWLPMVRSITRSVSEMTRATEQIAEGRFDARVHTARKDELGRLGLAINRMAGRLSGFVAGPKRFLGDIAHELCSPIARIQMALGVLEQQAGDKQKGYVEDAREDVQEMSSLVEELLSFSRAALQQKQVQLEPVSVAEIVARVTEREASAKDRVTIQIPTDLTVIAQPELLKRALSNLVRNAIRYGGDGPITISGASNGETVHLTVADSGPGVPNDALQQIFDPFFRVEASRSRETGGAGLGLAIVKTCVEACQGTVSARNRRPAGLEVGLTLKSAPQSQK